MPYQHEIQEQIIFEISKNIKAGIFKTTPNRESKSFIWRTLEFITNSDGAILKGYICCTKCGQIFKYIGRRTSKIYRHPCISGNEVVSVLKNGTITVPNDWLEQQQTANNMNPTWQIFDVTLKEDGNNLEAVISCRLCKVILKYDDSLKTVAQPQTHKCLTLKDGYDIFYKKLSNIG